MSSARSPSCAVMESTAVIKGLHKAVLLPTALGPWCCPVLAAQAEVHLYKSLLTFFFFFSFSPPNNCLIKYLHFLVAAEQITLAEYFLQGVQLHFLHSPHSSRSDEQWFVAQWLAVLRAGLVSALQCTLRSSKSTHCDTKVWALSESTSFWECCQQRMRCLSSGNIYQYLLLSLSALQQWECGALNAAEGVPQIFVQQQNSTALQQPRPWHSQPWLQLARGCTSPPLVTAVLGALLAAVVSAAVMVQPTAPTFPHGTANACRGAVVVVGCPGGTLTFTKEFYRGQISLSPLKDGVRSAKRSFSLP